MEHQTGPDGPDLTEHAEQASTVRPGGPEPAREADDAGPTAGEPEPGPIRTREQASDQAREPASAPATGEPRVDAALRLLERLPDLPVNEHPELFELVHAQLSDVLGELDSGPAGPAGG
jgi:hypothetical protein